MRFLRRPVDVARRGLFGLAAFLAFIAQIAVALTPLAEGRDGIGMAAHIEAPGSRTHFTHDESTCAACLAQSLHGTAVRRAPVFLPAERQTNVVVAAAPLVLSVDLSFHLYSRAPPSVI